jgi:hypothetical protein
MKKSLHFILVSLFVLSSINFSFSQSTELIWTTVDIQSPTIESYSAIKEYNETLVLHYDDNVYFFSTDGGLVWENLTLPTMTLPLGAQHPNTYSVMFKDNGLAVGIRNASYENSIYITEGFGSMSFFNSTTLNFDIFDNFFENHTPDGCYHNYGSFDYVNGNFIKRRHSVCSASQWETTVCLKNTFAGNNSKETCRDYIFYTPDSLYYEKSMILSELIGSETTFSFADSLNNEFYALNNARGADFTNDILYYIDNNFFIQKNPQTAEIDSLAFDFQNPIGFAVYNDSIFIADSLAIYTASLENINDLSEFINFQSAGYKLRNVDFFQTGIFANTEEDKILRIDRNNATFSPISQPLNYLPYQGLATNGKNLFVNKISNQNIGQYRLKVQSNGNLAYSEDYFSSIEDPFYYGLNEWDSLICIKNPSSYNNYLLLKKTSDLQYDTLLSLTGSPIFKSNNESLFIISSNDIFYISTKEAKFEEYTETNLPNSNFTKIAADNIGNLFIGNNFGYIYQSNNAGESWDLILNSTTYFNYNLFGYGGEVWLNSNRGNFYKWNENTNSFENKYSQETIDKDYYLKADNRTGKVVIQYAGEGKIFGVDVFTDTISEIEVPFSYYKSNISGYPYGNLEHGASSYAIVGDTIYALSEAGLMKAAICEIVPHVLEDERYFCQGDSIEIDNTFYDTEGEVMHVVTDEVGCKTLFTSSLIEVDSTETDYFYIEAGEEFNGVPLYETTSFVGQTNIDLESMCPVSQVQLVYVNSDDFIYGYFSNENEASMALLAYPNPANDKLFLKIPKNEKISFPTVLITDINGKEYQFSFDLVSNKLTVDISTLNTGMYFLTLKAEEKNSTLRFVKM